MVGDQERNPPATSVEVRDLILQMLKLDPKERISIFDIFEHKWM